jgi:hypothetical protein
MKTRSQCVEYVFQDGCKLDKNCHWVRGRLLKSGGRGSDHCAKNPAHRGQNQWIDYVKKVRAQHPNMSYKMALEAASATYTKKQRGGGSCTYGQMGGFGRKKYLQKKTQMMHESGEAQVARTEKAFKEWHATYPGCPPAAYTAAVLKHTMATQKGGGHIRRY